MYLFALKRGIIPAGNEGCVRTLLTGKNLRTFAENWCKANGTDAVFALPQYSQHMCEMSPQRLTNYVRTYGTFICMR